MSTFFKIVVSKFLTDLETIKWFIPDNAVSFWTAIVLLSDSTFGERTHVQCTVYMPILLYSFC